MKSLQGQMSDRIWNWIWILLSAGTLLFAAVVLYDMQTAEGIGLYFALQMGAEDRRSFDLLAVLAGMVCLLVLLVLPCVLWKRLRPASFFRLLCGYLAFLPAVSTADLVHLLAGTQQIQLRAEFISGSFGMGLKEGLAQVMPAFVMGVPLLLLALAVEKESSGECVMSKRWRVILVVQVLLIVGALLFPALTPHFSFLFRYLLLLEGFVVWEKLWDRYPALNAWGWILFGGCYLRGIYMMMEIMSRYHL